MWKAFRWFPWAVLVLIVDYWKLAALVIGGSFAAFALFAQGDGWVIAGLQGAGYALALCSAANLICAMYLSWRDRDKPFRMF